MSDDTQDSAPKNVGFAPLSPQSSRTMLRHHVETGQAIPGISEKSAGKLPMNLPSAHEDDDSLDDSRALTLSSYGRRSDRNDRDRRDYRDDDEVETLPDRFDSRGQPLSGSGASSSRPGRSRSGFTSRRGDFEYRNPKRDDGWNIRGQWGVAGTDDSDVERIANGMKGALDGFGSGSSKLPGIFGLIGGVLEGLSAFNSSRQLEDGYGPDDRRDGRSDDRNRDRQHHHYASSDDDRKRKRRNTYDTAQGVEGQSRRRDRRRRSSSAGRFTDGYFFDHDGYDGQEGRKRRRSWAS